MSATRVYALMKGGRTYTVINAWNHKPFRYIAFCDGNRCGAFRSKKAFEEFVANEPDFEQFDKGPQIKAAKDAEMWANFEARSILQRITDNCKKGGDQK